MKALINPNEKAYYNSSYTQVTYPDGVTGYESIQSEITNGCRICQVEETEFEMAPPNFWVECNSSVTATGYYYDISDNTIKPIVHADYPS